MKNKIKKKGKFSRYLFLLIFGMLFIGIFSYYNISNKVAGMFIDKKNLFDLSVSINPEFKIVSEGENLLVNVKIVNFGSKETKDISLKYTIWDKNRMKKISEMSEVVAIQTTMSIIKQIHIPEDALPGNYIIEVEIIHNNETIKADNTFEVKKINYIDYEIIIFITGIFIALVSIAILYQLKRLNKSIKINENMIIEKKLIKMKGGKKS